MCLQFYNQVNKEEVQVNLIAYLRTLFGKKADV